MKTFSIVLLLALVASVTATGELVTSLSRDFATVNSYAPGGWHYDMLWNNGTRTPMTYDSAQTRWWTESNGDGFITNNSGVFGAEFRKSTVFYPPTVAGGHAVQGNLSANWTANFTGTMSLSGWFKMGTINALGYNVSVWHNSALLFSQKVAAGDATNYTFSVSDSVATGDNITFVGGAGTIGESPHINATMDVINTTVTAFTPFDPGCVGSTCYKFYQNFSNVQGTRNVSYVYSLNAGTTWPKMTWNGTSWLMTANYQAGGIQNQTNGLFTAHTSDDAGNGKYVGFEIANNYDFRSGMNFSGTIKKNSCAGGDGIVVKVRSGSNTQTVYTIPGVCANTSFNSFSVNLTNVVAGSIYVFVDGVTTDSNDNFQFANWTLSGNGTYDGILRVRAFDESNPSLQKQFNLTISNDTNSTDFVVNYSNAPEFNKSLSQLPTGIILLSIRNNTCLTGNVIPRQYSLNTATDDLNISAYLLCDSSTPILVSFNIEDSRSARIANALVSAYKSIGSSLQLVTSKLSDSSGVAALYLDVNTVYNIRVSATGYDSYSSFITPSSSSYTIVLTNANSSVGFQTIFDGLYFQITPENSYLLPDVNNLSLLSFYLNDSLSLLNFWGWNISFNGTQLYMSNLTPNASGGYEQVLLNLTNRSGGVVNVSYWFSRSNFTLWQLNRSYFIDVNNQSNASFVGALGRPKSDGAPSFMMTMVAFVLISFVTALYNRYVMTGAGMVSLALWGLVAIMGYVSWVSFGIIAMAYGGYVVMTRAY